MKKCQLLFFIFLSLFFCDISVKAASFSMSSSDTQVAPNGTFTIKVGGDCIGRVNLSVNNGTLSTNSVWVEEGFVSVRVTAGSSGSVTVTATPAEGFSDSDANIYAPGARKVTVSIVSSGSSGGSSSSTNKKPTSTPQDKKSGNNDLSSLRVSVGTLSPAFQPSNEKYTLDLPIDVFEISLEAIPMHALAKVSGSGKVKLQAGENEIKIEVLAENGNKKTYTLLAYVEEKPKVFIEYQDKKIGIITYAKDIPNLDSFTSSVYEIQEEKIVLYKKDKLTFIYGQSEDNQRDFYLFDTEKNEIINKVVPAEFSNRIFYFREENANRFALPLEFITLQNVKIPCYTFSANPNYCLLYAQVTDGNILEYLYEKTEETIQLYPAFLENVVQKEGEKTNYVAIILGILLFLSISFILFSHVKKGGKIYEKKN